MKIYLLLSTIFLGDWSFNTSRPKLTPYRYAAKACAELEKNSGTLFVLDMASFSISEAQCNPVSWDVITGTR